MSLKMDNLEAMVSCVVCTKNCDIDDDYVQRLLTHSVIPESNNSSRTRNQSVQNVGQNMR